MTNNPTKTPDLIERLRSKMPDDEVSNNLLREIEAALNNTTLPTQNSEQHHTFAFDNALCGQLFLSLDGVIKQANDKAAQLFNRNKEQITNTNIDNYLTVKSILDLHLHIYNLGKQEKSLRFELSLNDGNSITYYVKCRLTAYTEALLLLQFNNISNQKVKENILIQAKQRAEEADKLKSAFLANISHEIRTPLNAIIGFSEYLKQKNPADKDKAILDVILKSSKNLLALMSDIIEISKIESKQVRVHKTACSLQGVLNDIGNQAIHQMSANKISQVAVTIHPPRNTFKQQIITDEGKLRQVLTNLIDNAIKFTDEGSVDVHYELITKQKEVLSGQYHSSDLQPFIRFSVHDTGIGIAEDKIDVIFEVFRQIDESITRKHGGTGLGLAITKGYVQLLGGEIWVESEIDRGSVFSFTIPHQESGKTEIDPSDSGTKPTYSWEQQYILIVEDDDDNSLALANMITDFAADVDIVPTVEVALQYCKQRQPNLILLDWDLNNLDNYDFLEQLRTTYPAIPIAVQCSNISAEFEQRMLQAGVTHCCSKYANANVLYRSIDELLKEKNKYANMLIF